MLACLKAYLEYGINLRVVHCPSGADIVVVTAHFDGGATA
ncbi:MAG: hypothetical protein JWO83_1530 [Caulobacteraceae bacterium]|nr:hypothetical protein [Caulobacteraceae bacterium]